MRKLFIFALCALLPLASVAGNEPESTAPNHNLRNILMLSAGVIVGAVIVDMLVGSALTIPAANVASPAIREASAAGAVFGEQVAAATAVRDAKARADVIYALLLGGGGVLGGWLASQFDFGKAAPATGAAIPEQ